MNGLACIWGQFVAWASGLSSRHLLAVYTCANYLHSHQTSKNVIPASFAITAFMYMVLYLSYSARTPVVNLIHRVNSEIILQFLAYFLKLNW